MGPNRMLMKREILFPKAIAARPDFDEIVQGYHRDVDIVFMEDVRAAELQHLGLASPINVPGRFPTYAEKLVHAFDNWVLDQVLDPA
ncbi:MAG TPA: SRPBCC family protein, partial [Gemmatimonadales bacterium]|nr:SRPBCC family protein [Gemmatimonadales bacterium]